MRSNKSILASLVLAIALPFSAFSAAATQPEAKKTIAPKISGDIADANGEVRVIAHINEYGFVTDAQIESSTNDALNEASLNAIHDWSFTPAQKDGHAVAAKVIQPFRFNQGSITLTSNEAEDTHPNPTHKVAPELEAALRNITGEVVLQASLDAAGHITSIEIKSSTHDELSGPASEALKHWDFSPATKSGETVASKVIVPFHFKGAGNFSEIASHATDAAAADRAPVATRRPTRDLARFIGDKRGEAKLLLVIDENGYVVDTQTVESSSEELAAHAREAALQWTFKPAIKDGVAVASKVLQPFSFNGGLLMTEEPIDQMPVARTTKSPELPKAMTGVNGYVQVRLQLDERGNVISASSLRSSHEELEQPTLQAAQQWKFKPAIRDGEDVSSTVVIPFVFNQKS